MNDKDAEKWLDTGLLCSDKMFLWGSVEKAISLWGWGGGSLFKGEDSPSVNLIKYLEECIQAQSHGTLGAFIDMWPSSLENKTLPSYFFISQKSHGWRSWWAAVHGVAKSWTRLRDFTFTFHFHALEKEMATHSSVLAWRIPGTGEPGGLLSMGLHRVRHDWSDLAAAAALQKQMSFL